MKIAPNSLPVFSIDDFTSYVYQDNLHFCHQLYFENNEEINQFNLFCEDIGIEKIKIFSAMDLTDKEIDITCQQNWLMPEEYKKINLSDFLLQKCSNELEKIRVEDELLSYKRHNLEMLLRYLIYLVDTLKENKILFGVGRGSSVASFILYLIGIHRINSLTYNLDYKEFLR